MYIGDGIMIDEFKTGDVVKIQSELVLNNK